MGLRDVNYKAAYVSGVDNLVRDFYIPTLAGSTLYQRRTGYFNSRALAMAARGLSGLLSNDGRMQLLCSVQLDQSEEAVLRDPVAYLERKAMDVASMLDAPYDELEKKRLGLLAHLLTTDKLEIRIGVKPGGIYHEKAGIFRDAKGDIVAFNGSGNETPGGWVNNTESFHVFTSWEDDRHIRPEIEIFERLWEGRDPKTTVIPLPFAVVKGIIEFKDYFREGMDEPVDPLDPVLSPTAELEWTPELAYILEAPRLWNHQDFAYGETAVEPYPHQDYIASSVLERWPPRVMFCDEVGLGKSIEAGLVIKGFLAAGRVDRLVVLAPKNTLPQLQNELYSKFALETWRLEGNHAIGPQLHPKKEPPRVPVDAANPFRTKPLLLVSSQLVRLEDRKEQFLGLEYDLVILDEAHHARARGPSGRREPNKLLEVLEELRYQTQGLVLMTATPIQLDRRELWDLLNVLELPGRWQDEEAFDNFFRDINSEAPNWEFLLGMVESSLDVWGIDEAAIQEISEDFPTVDAYQILQIMKDKQVHAVQNLGPQEKTALKILLFRHTPVRRMVFRNTRELLKKYKAEGKLQGSIADRDPVKEEVELQGDPEDPTSERGLYERIDHYVREYYAKYDAIRNGLGFIMETYRKRLTSSLQAIKISLDRRRKTLREALDTGDYGRLIHDLTEEDRMDLPESTQDDFAAELEGRTTGIMAWGKGDHLRKTIEAEHDFLEDFLRDLKALPIDSKAEHLDHLLEQAFARGTRQVMVFSQFKDTVEFLLNHFLQRYGTRLGSYTGEGGTYWTGTEWAACSKQEIQAKFKDQGDPLSILICTDAASEGLNLQTCDTLVNYDIPWNPMRIEQRIGRIDRIGQESPLVRIHTIFYADTVEARVYERCLERIGHFKSALGHLQPILQSTEKAIRKAALAKDKDQEKEVLEEMEKEYQETVAQTEENLRIERLLNHYNPRLPSRTKESPISQSQLEEVLTPYLEKAGWTHREDGTWARMDQIVTFDPKYRDTTGKEAELIMPTSQVAKLLDRLPELPVSITVDRTTIHRLEVGGITGFAKETSQGVYLVHRLDDIQTSKPSGERYETVDQAREGLRYKIQQQRKRTVEADLIAWKNRKKNWEIRVRMYLDKLANWRFRTIRKEHSLQHFAPESFHQDWSQYISEPERISTKQLAEIIGYRPGKEAMERKRGRVTKKSPRDSAKEKQMLEEIGRITRKVSILSEQM